VVSLAAALLSAGFTFVQASEASRANDMLAAEQARNVYVMPLDGELGGVARFSIRNDNKQPITNLRYHYELNGIAAPTAVAVGMLRGCSSVELTPANDDDDKPGFNPTVILYTDPQGNSWRRDRDGQLTPISDPLGDARSSSSGTVTEIRDC
jgi:hypothetical protein